MVPPPTHATGISHRRQTRPQPPCIPCPLRCHRSGTGTPVESPHLILGLVLVRCSFHRRRFRQVLPMRWRKVIAVCCVRFPFPVPVEIPIVITACPHPAVIVHRPASDPGVSSFIDKPNRHLKRWQRPFVVRYLCPVHRSSSSLGRPCLCNGASIGIPLASRYRLLAPSRK